ncbi:MAG: hypothetical protein IAF58_02310 [Leptolyngbya sp.]|nr:hypothetical protein [Candidatus Melainabacteria bacterium]
MRQWPKLTQKKRIFPLGEKTGLSRCAEYIVAGRILEGMTKPEILEKLGKPQKSHLARPLGKCDEFLVFNAADCESQCDLCLELNNGKVTKAFMDVNY